MASQIFHTSIDLRYTALLLADIQNEILARFPVKQQEQFLQEVLSLLQTFRKYAAEQRAAASEQQRDEEKISGLGAYEGVPLIIHHVLPYGYNNNEFISPYNKLASWVKSLQDKGFFPLSEGATDPEKPVFSIPELLLPPGVKFGHNSNSSGSVDEVLVAKFQTSSFGSSDLLAYLRAQGIRHIILCGLTTVGAILGSARHGADLDHHIVIPRNVVTDDEEEVNDFVLSRILPKFVDVVDVTHVKGLFNSGD